MIIHQRDVPELLRLMRTHLGAAPARQLLGDWYRSKAAEKNAEFRDSVRKLMIGLDEASVGPNAYQPTKESANGERRG